MCVWIQFVHYTMRTDILDMNIDMWVMQIDFFDKKVINFKRKLGEDFINRVANQYDIKTIELENLDDRFIGSSAIYPNVGDICDYVKGLSLKYIYSKLDILSIPKCDAGYFKFKKSIHSFIEKGESHV